MNEDIRSPMLRLLDEKNNMVGIMSREEALTRARAAELDLGSSSPEELCFGTGAFSKYRYEQQKKKRELQKKAAANRSEMKELKMRYNIDTHDYEVRLRSAVKFLQDGDRVKLSVQFRGREMEFRDLGVKLFERFQGDVSEFGVVETKVTMEGRTMLMVLAPNKAALQKSAAAQAKAEKAQARAERNAKRPEHDPDDEATDAEDADDDEDLDEDSEDLEEPEQGASRPQVGEAVNV
eukprot:SM000106S13970  [mRNA]  locus=s106:188286:190627:- [translate_table: standard]